MAAITSGQRAKIFASAKEKGFDNEELHEIIFQCTKKNSIKLLTSSEAIKVIERLEGKSQPNKQDKNRISPKQEKLIKDMTKELGHDEAWLKEFIKTNTKVDVMSWLTKVQASNVIEGLKETKLHRKEGKANEL